MDIYLYNTFTREKAKFEPLDKKHVKMYVCGPTVYAPPHIGNGRPVVVFDVLFRLLNAVYPNVTYVRNITDVDDKINQQALEEGKPIESITSATIKCFNETCAYLGSLTPSVEPRVTQHMAEIINMISKLIEKEYAYERDGHVLYRVHKFEGYGNLSRKNQDELIAGARVDVAPYKENPEDFVLWKPSVSPTPGWESPFGFGRPGWHIECSAMSETHLGDTFDIHGGGIDLVFPHHENEIAQSVACHDAPMANVWMHNGHLSVEGKKMSKSLGNVIIIQDLMHNIKGQVVRFALLSSHYRQPLDWTHELVAQSQAAINRMYTALKDLDVAEWNKPLVLENVQADALGALQDDLNTPLVFKHMHDLVKQVNTATADEKYVAQVRLLHTGKLLGFFSVLPTEWFQATAIEDAEFLAKVEALLAQRLEAKERKDFVAADNVRDALKAMGVRVIDTPKGQEWQREDA
jgi:cysteinyl-tRNA synthetase